MSEWMAVGEQLPEISETVLVYHETFGILMARRELEYPDVWLWVDCEGFDFPEMTVTHYMPLPEPPQ